MYRLYGTNRDSGFVGCADGSIQVWRCDGNDMINGLSLFVTKTLGSSDGTIRTLCCLES